MRTLILLVVLSILAFGCQKENPPVASPAVTENSYWPLQKYARWVFSRTVTGATPRDIVLGPKTAEKPAYFPFAKAPNYNYEGLHLNNNGELELVWKYLNGQTQGVLCPKIIPEPGQSWFSTPAYFYLIDDRAGVAIYDSLRFEVYYNRYWESFTIPFDVPKTYYSVADFYIRTQIWHKFEERWEEPVAEQRLFLAKNIGPVVINNGFSSEFLLEARTHY